MSDQQTRNPVESRVGSFFMSLAQSAIIGIVTASVVAYGTLARLDVKFEYVRETSTLHADKIRILETQAGQHSTQIMQLQTQMGFVASQLNEVIAGQRTIANQLSLMNPNRQQGAR